METARRYAAVGGFAAWRAPIMGVGIAAGGLLAGEWSIVGFAVILGLVVDAIDRGTVFEASSRGLIRSAAVGGVLVGPARILPWATIEEIATDWRHPHDSTTLVTHVLTRDHDSMVFSTRMGLGAYWALLHDVTARAPRARRTGLTDQVLAETPSGWRPLSVRRTAVIAAIALVALWIVAGGW